MSKVTGHVQEYIGRYVMFASIVLVPLAGALGAYAAELGGNDTKLGKTVQGAASAIGAAAAIGVWMRNLGVWQVAELAEVQKLEVGDVDAVPVAPDVPPGEPGGGAPLRAPRR